jgi:hypothetical protein
MARLSGLSDLKNTSVGQPNFIVGIINCKVNSDFNILSSSLSERPASYRCSAVKRSVPSLLHPSRYTLSTPVNCYRPSKYPNGANRWNIKAVSALSTLNYSFRGSKLVPEGDIQPICENAAILTDTPSYLPNYQTIQPSCCINVSAA